MMPTKVTLKQSNPRINYFKVSGRDRNRSANYAGLIGRLSKQGNNFNFNNEKNNPLSLLWNMKKKLFLKKQNNITTNLTANNLKKLTNLTANLTPQEAFKLKQTLKDFNQSITKVFFKVPLEPEVSSMCSHCCWKEIRPWWPRMQSFSRERTNTNILIKPVRANFAYQSASPIAQEISWKSKERESFVQICTSIFEEIQKCKHVKGIRICRSGRSNGAEIAQTECMKEGSTSKNVSSDCLDYAKAETSTRYGISGIKVWISYYP